MTLLVKYCGGCNVYYDRPALVAEITRKMPGLSVTTSGETADFVAVLCGCPSQCLPHDHLTGTRGKRVLSGAPGQAEALMADLAALTAGDGGRD